MFRNDVRTRLTLWHIGGLSLVLIGFSLVIHLRHERDLARRMDADLKFVASSSVITLQHEGEEAAAAGKSLSEMDPDFLSEHLAQLRPAALVLDDAGKILVDKAVSGVDARKLPRRLTDLPRVETGTIQTVDGFRVVTARIPLGTPQKDYFLLVGEPTATIQSEMALLRRTLLISCPIAVLVVGALGWFLVGKTLEPVQRMSEQARSMGDGNLGRRLVVENPGDELGFLAQTFNDLLGRVQAAFERQRQFMVDASHELRTPLSVIRTTTEVTLSADSRMEAEYREALNITDEQVRRLTRIVEDMFLLARDDAAQAVVRADSLYLDETVEEAVRAIRVLAAGFEVRVELESMPEMPFRGDAALLRQLFLNLLDNAVKHTPADGVVRVCGGIDAGRYIIQVTDTGPGIPDALKPFIFDRFFRGDSARPNQCSLVGAGAGLGLSIARRISELHHGTLELTDSNPTGSCFTVNLPG